MALPTYLQLVNDVLVRLREPEVSSVNENVLSKLIGKFVNDSKRQVEDSYNWNALVTTLTATTSPDVFNYALVGVGQRFKVIEVYNITSRNRITPISTIQMTQYFLGGTTVAKGIPFYYNFNGINSDGDTQLDIFPVPNDVFNLYFNLYVPQDNLLLDSNTLKVPSEPVVQLAIAKALVERGEDGALQSSEAYGLFKQSLADFIAIEASRYPEEDAWVVV